MCGCMIKPKNVLIANSYIALMQVKRILAQLEQVLDGIH